MKQYRLIRYSLLTRFLLAFLLPTVGLILLFSYLVYDVVERYLENELGLRLEAIAASVSAVSTLQNVYYLLPGDEGTRNFSNIQKKLKALQQATGVASITVFDNNGYILISTTEGETIGRKFYRGEIDAKEILLSRKNGKAQSVLFKGLDGQFYKNGYAILPPPGEEQFQGVIPAIIAVAGSPAYFTVLNDFKNSLILLCLGVIATLIITSFFITRSIAKPVRTLVDAALRIAKGDLETQITVKGGGEITFLARTMEEMRNAISARDRQMQLMLAGIAHEIRNPLSGLELFASLLEEDLSGSPEQLKKIERIIKEIDYLKRVVEEFLNYARTKPPAFEHVKAEQFFTEVVELMAPEALKKQVTLEKEVPKDTMLYIDREMLKRALLNLVLNGIQAIKNEAGGKVRILVSGGIGKETALISVEDDGAGITDDIKDKIFEPFFTTRPKGTGLGLAFAAKAVQLHDGSLTYDKSSLGGASFIITLPQPKS